MMKRFTQAIRLLLGRPLTGLAVDGTMLLDAPAESEHDYARMPPFDLAFPGHVALAPPVKVVRQDRLRVCVFPEIDGEHCCECGRPLHWFVLELRGKNRWYHLLTVHESKLVVMLSVLEDVGKFLEQP